MADLMDRGKRDVYMIHKNKVERLWQVSEAPIISEGTIRRSRDLCPEGNREGIHDSREVELGLEIWHHVILWK